MKQLTDAQLINFLSVVLGITFSLLGLMIWYFKNEIQRQIEFGNKMFNNYYNTSFRVGIYNNQNKKYSKICRRLYDENNNLKMDVQGLESLFVDMKNKANEFELKIVELESGKLKKRDRKL